MLVLGNLPEELIMLGLGCHSVVQDIKLWDETIMNVLHVNLPQPAFVCCYHACCQLVWQLCAPECI